MAKKKSAKVSELIPNVNPTTVPEQSVSDVTAEDNVTKIKNWDSNKITVTVPDMTSKIQNLTPDVTSRIQYLINVERAARLICQKYENLAKSYSSYPSKEDEIKYLEYSRIYNGIVDEIEEFVKHYEKVDNNR